MAEDVSILSEIDDALRVDNLKQFWARYGKTLIAFCVLVVLASSGSVLWKSHLRSVHERQTALLAKAATVETTGKNDEAIGYYAQVEGQGGPLAEIAGLRHAALLVSMNQQEKALALYKSVANGQLGDTQMMRDFANLEIMILNSNIELGASAPAKKGPIVITNGSGAFFSSEAEIGALNALRAGDRPTAVTILTGIVSNKSAPYSQRLRDSELADAIREQKK